MLGPRYDQSRGIARFGRNAAVDGGARSVRRAAESGCRALPHRPPGRLRWGSRCSRWRSGWELYERTHSALALGLVGLTQMVPMVLFTLPAGHVADNYDRKRIIVLMNLVVACASLGLTLISALGAPCVLDLFLPVRGGHGAHLSLAGQLGVSAAPGLAPGLFPGGDVEQRQFPTLLGGRAGGGRRVDRPDPSRGPGLCVQRRRRADLPHADQLCAAAPYGGGEGEDDGGQLDRGVQIRIRQPDHPGNDYAGFVRGAAGRRHGAVAGLCQGHSGRPARRVWVSSRRRCRWARCSARWCWRTGRRLQKAGRAMLLAVAGFGLATIAFGFSRWFWFSFLMLFVCGAMDNISVVVRHTLVQLLTPDEKRGRVSAVNSLFIGTSNELGGFESGLVAYWLGPVFSVVSGGVGTILVVLAVAVIWPEIRKYGRLDA